MIKKINTKNIDINFHENLAVHLHLNENPAIHNFLGISSDSVQFWLILVYLHT